MNEDYIDPREFLLLRISDSAERYQKTLEKSKRYNEQANLSLSQLEKLMDRKSSDKAANTNLENLSESRLVRLDLLLAAHELVVLIDLYNSQFPEKFDEAGASRSAYREIVEGIQEDLSAAKKIYALLENIKQK